MSDSLRESVIEASMASKRHHYVPQFYLDYFVIKSHAPEWAEDYPAGTRRLIQRAEGVRYTVVNGDVIYKNDNLSGEMAGQVLRSVAYQGK